MYNNLVPISTLDEYVNKKYNYLRLYLYNLILYHSYVESYILEYKNHLNKIETEIPVINTILNEKTRIITLPSIAEKARFSVKNTRRKDGSLYIIGKDATRKYRVLVVLRERLYTYEKELKEYVKRIEERIVSLSNNIERFRFLYKLHISMCLEREEAYEMKELEKILGNIATRKKIAV